MIATVGRGGSAASRVIVRARQTMYEAQPEGLINFGRLVTSSFALLAVYLDPTQPIINVSEIYEILAVYVAFSVSVVLLRSSLPLGDPLHAVSTAIDVAILGILAIISEHLDSPFFIFFNFTLITAAIRWGLQGVLITALVLQIELLQIGIPDLEAGDYALNVLIIRSVYCWVAAVMLGYFGSYRKRSEYRLSALADWPLDFLPGDESPWLSTSLQHASNVLETERIFVLWRDRDHPLAHLAWWAGAECQFSERLTLDNDCACLLEEGGGDRLTATSATAVLQALGRSIPSSVAGLQERISRPSQHAIHIMPFASMRYRGSLIVIDPARDESIKTLIRIVASRVAMQLEQFSLARDYAAAASFKERARLARDLHDSVLQDLTAAVLQLDAAAKSLPARWIPVLAQVPELLKMQQRRIREFVTDTRAQAAEDRLLVDQLTDIVDALQSQWGCRLTLIVQPPSLKVDQAVAAELCLAISEATANAVRHGAAREVEIFVQGDRERLNIVMRNDTRSIPEASGSRPYSLNTRAAALGGRLIVAVDEAAYQVTMDVPLNRNAR